MPPKRYFEQAEAEAAGAAAANDAAPTAAAAGAASSSTSDSRNATLFVSRLPYTATSTDLETLFSDIGPLKRAFVVTDPTTKSSKGVGYVTFAMAEDAKTALQQLQGKSLDGKRKMQISIADEKAPMKERKAARALLAAQATQGGDAAADTASAAKKPRYDKPAGQQSAARPRPTFEKDADAVRTVILSGLAACTAKADSKQIYKRARKIGDVENVVYPHPGSSRPDDVAHVIFRTPNHAMTAVEKLHAHTFKGVQISAILKKRADGATKLAAHMRPETLAKREKMRQDIEKFSGKGSMPVITSEVDKSSRLIIRNLPFDVTEADLRAVFLPHGPIFQIQIPKALPKNSSNSAKEEEGDAEEQDDEAGQDKSSSDDNESDSDSDKGSGVTSGSDDDEDGTDSDEADNDEDKAEEDKEEDEDAELNEVEQSSSAAAKGERGRGFAFVWHVSRNDAAKALKAVNGKPIRHGAAEHAAYKAAKGKKGRDAAKKVLDAVRAAAQPERVVAVDWALSKKDWEAKAEQSDAEEAESEDDEDDDEDEGEDDDEEGDDDDDENAEVSSDEEAKPALPQPEEGTTLFVRNLPFQATEEELKSVFRHFGPLRYAKITMDKATNRSKGTGFVCFWQASSADAALAQARIIEKEAGTSGSASTAASAGKNPFALPSVLTADPSAPLTASLNLHGRVLNVIPAVARTEASKLETSGRKQREKEDKRNTWLLREGVPFPESAIARTLSAGECEKRLQSFTIRRSQLGSNPALFISKTRLAVRQLPLFVSDKMLKKLALHALRSFKDEVKAEERVDLDEYERADRTISATLAEDGGFAAKKKGERPTAVLQAKVVRQADRIDPLTGQGRSRGYGFLEMRTFQEALKVVRWANGNPAVSTLFTEWWQHDIETRIETFRRQIKAKSSAGGGGGGTLSSEVKEEIDEMEARIKRMQRKVDELKAGQKPDKSERGGLLVLEFSIENATVTRKRKEMMDKVREGNKRKAASSLDPDRAQPNTSANNVAAADKSSSSRSGGRTSSRPSSSASSSFDNKKGRSDKRGDKTASTSERRAQHKASQKIDRHKESAAGADGSKKFGSLYGSSIGRKRRAKKMGKK